MKRYLMLVLALLLVLPALLLSQDKSQAREKGKAGSLWKGAGTPFQNVMDINNISIWAKADGWHPNAHNGVAAGTYPKGTNGWGWAAGWLFGGKVSDGGSQIVRVGGNLDRPGMQAGRILTDASGKVTGREDPSAADVRIWRVRPDWQAADLKDDASYFFDKSFGAVTDADVAALRAQYQKDWNEWPANKGAPYLDKNGNGTYDAASDVPGVPGADQTLWLVANDLSESQSTQFYGSMPTGIEFQLTMWAYASSTPLNDAVFYRARYIYKGTSTTPANSHIDSMYVAYWADPDLGDYTDDFVQCDTTLNLGFAWNSTTLDRDFRALGVPVPSFGWDFLNGVARRTGNASDSAIVDLKWRKGYKYVLDKPFSGFVRGAAGVQDPPYPGGQYNQTLQWYNAMRGYKPTPQYPEGDPYTDPNTGVATRYTVAGDPVRGTGWIDGQDIPPGDRRLSMINGPFTLNVRDTAEVVFAMVGGQGADNLSSITVMKYNDIFAQYAFDNLFELPKSPATPKVEVAELDKEIVLSWGDAAQVDNTENTVIRGFAFEGYNVYQFPTSDGRISDAMKLATYDLLNNITTIVDQTVDPATGVIIGKAAQIGRNAGVQRYIKHTRDAFSGKPLTNGRDYYFAVTAYSYNGDATVPFHSLESAPVVVRVTPQPPKPGTRYLASVGDTVRATHTGGSDGKVLAFVIDPTKVTGHTYRVNFTTSSGISTVWSLTDATSGQVKLTGQSNQSGDDNYPIVDGLLIKVFGAANDFKRFVMTANGNGPITQTYGFTATPAPSYGGYSADWYRDVIAGGNTSLTLPNSMQKKVGWFFVTGFSTDADHATATNSWTANASLWPRIIPNDYEIRFTARGGKAWLGFSTKAVIDVPFEIWFIGSGTPNDASDDVRMVPWILDDDGDGQWNFHLDHTASGGNNDPYSDPIYWYKPDNATPGEAGYNALIAALGPTHDGSGMLRHLRGWTLMNWNQRAGTGAANEVPEVGTVIRIESNKPNLPADAFTFAAPTVQSSTDLAKLDIEMINVFPNPYYGFNVREKTRLTKFVTFSHLPKKATIRIYTLGAMLVKTIVKEDDTQFTTWDLRNQNNLPVASGIYIVHVDLPDLGATKFLKLAIVQEDQFLRIY